MGVYVRHGFRYFDTANGQMNLGLWVEEVAVREKITVIYRKPHF